SVNKWGNPPCWEAWWCWWALSSAPSALREQIRSSRQRPLIFPNEFYRIRKSLVARLFFVYFRFFLVLHHAPCAVLCAAPCGRRWFPSVIAAALKSRRWTAA